MTTTQSTYTVRGTTDDVTECGVCGKVELKGTMVLEADGDTIYAGMSCGAKLAGRPVKEMRAAAKEADRSLALRVAQHRNAEQAARIARRLKALGVDPGFPAIKAWMSSPAELEAAAAWLREHPVPTV